MTGRAGDGIAGTQAATAELREALRWRLVRARRRTDEMFTLLRDEAFHERPVKERHRLVFYLGHLEAFDANLIGRDALGGPPVDAYLDWLFAFGIDPLPGGSELPHDSARDWPALNDVRAYVARARSRLDRALAAAPLDGSVPWLQDGWCLRLAIEHRLMHAETLSYLIRRLPHALKHPRRPVLRDETPPRPQHWLEVPEGVVTLGLDRATRPREGWDNEYDAHEVRVPAFSLAAHDVTNADYLPFVREGGYRERSLWDERDWNWIQAEGIEHPGSWIERGGAYSWRGMHGLTPLPPSWPAWVSHAEATAFARWAGRRLITEAEYQRAALGTPDGVERLHPWGDEPPSKQHGVFNFERFEPVPAGSRPRGNSAWGASDLAGNGWKWTSTVFAPFPGFQALPFYPGYSADFFDGRHFVMKGAGPRTSAALMRPSFRNWFQPHYRHAEAAIRLADSGTP